MGEQNGSQADVACLSRPGRSVFKGVLPNRNRQSTHRGKSLGFEDVKKGKQKKKKNLKKDLLYINDNNNKVLSQIKYFDHQKRGY